MSVNSVVIPSCPGCGRIIGRYDNAEVVIHSASGAKCLVHTECAEMVSSAISLSSKATLAPSVLTVESASDVRYDTCRVELMIDADGNYVVGDDDVSAVDKWEETYSAPTAISLFTFNITVPLPVARKFDIKIVGDPQGDVTLDVVEKKDS